MLQLYRVGEPEEFDRRPELAMGLHFAVGAGGRRGAYLDEAAFVVFNATVAVRVHDLLQANESISSPWMQGGPGGDGHGRKLKPLELIPCEDVEFLIRVASLPEWSQRRFRRHGRVHGSPPFSAQSRAGQAFVRLSAFPNDRRITADGGLVGGTFATSKLDAAMVPTALTAVGHYALPTILPPVYRFEIVPPPLTDFYYGTVSPAFGQSGGGTEIEFFSGVADGAVSGPSMIPYL